MKNFFNPLFAMAAIAAIATVSCQNEERFDAGITPGTLVEAQFHPVIPSAASLSSGDGGVTNLDEGTYNLRYILEVWSDDGVDRVHRDTLIADDYGTGVTFSVRLPADMYKFIFWADFVADGSEDDLTYNTGNDGGLKDIVWTASSYAISSNLRDAYYAVKDVDLTSASVSDNVTLKRPFGKLRILATDDFAGADVTPAKAQLTYTHADPPLFRKSFNALTGLPNAATINASGELESIPTTETIAIQANETEYTATYLVAFDYFLVPGDLTGVSFDIEIFDGGDNSLSKKSISNVPVEVNKLTTVIGAFLPTFTEGDVTFEVIVDEAFVGDHIRTTEVESVALNKTDLELGKGESETLIATVLPTHAANKNVTWSSSNPDVATVDANGLVTASTSNTGTATITAKSAGNSQKRGACTVTVTTPAKATPLAQQLGETRNGETITLTKDASINADVEVPAGVTLVVPAGKTLTVTGTLSGAGAITVAGIVDAATSTFAGNATLQDGSKSRGLVEAPTDAATGWVWTFGSQTWSDRITISSCNGTISGAPDEPRCGSKTTLDGVIRYYYNYYYVSANTPCSDGWSLPADNAVLNANTTKDHLWEIWGLGGGYDSWGGWKTNSDDMESGGDARYSSYWTTTAATGANTGKQHHIYIGAWGIQFDDQYSTKSSYREVRCVKNSD